MNLNISAKKNIANPVKTNFIQDNLIFEALKVTEAGALAAAEFIGKGDEKAADQAAVDAMRQAFDNMPMEGEVVIGEGERDEAPMLYIGEKVGNGKGPVIDIALDPLEGTSLTAKNYPNALVVLALALKGGFLNAPDIYMKKIAIGPGLPNNTIDITKSASDNIKNLAQAKNMPPNDINVCVLERERHQEIITEIRQLGAKITLIPDGDIYAIIAACDPDSDIDLYIGSGGAPEGVLAAAALNVMGGQMQAQLLFNNDNEKLRAKKFGIVNYNKIYHLNELAHGDVVFIASGVTDGGLLDGVEKNNLQKTVNSLILHKNSKTKRYIKTAYIKK